MQVNSLVSLNYLNTAIRNFNRNKLSTLLNIFCLALGITSFIIAYILENNIASTDSHFERTERIRFITERSIFPGAEEEVFHTVTSRTLSKYLEIEFPNAEAVAYEIGAWGETVEYDGTSSERIVSFVNPDFLKVFDFDYIAGEGDLSLTQPSSAVITRTAAEAVFGTTDVIGKTVLISGDFDVAIRSVIEDIPTPSSFSQSIINSDKIDLFISFDVFQDMVVTSNPASITDFTTDRWFLRGYSTYVLLPDDDSLSLNEFETRLEGFGQKYVPPRQGVASFQSYPINEITGIILNQYLLDGKLGLSIGGVLYFLGSLILIIATLNFTNLAIVQIISRNKEIGVRKVVGAKRSEILGQYLFETLLLCLAAMVVSVLCIQYFLGILNNNTDFNIAMPWYLGIRFWLFLGLLSVTVSLIAGIYPGLLLARLRPIVALGKGDRKSISNHLRTTLIGLQYFAASVLLIAVIVMYLQYSYLRDSALGQSDDPMVVIYPSLREAEIDFETFEREMSLNQNVLSITGVGNSPWIHGYTRNRFTRSPDKSSVRKSIQARVVSHDYFQTFDVPLVSGRHFSREIASDLYAVENFDAAVIDGVPSNTIIDRTAAIYMGWDNPSDAIGENIYKYSQRRDTYLPLTIVGVVEDTPLHLREREGAIGNIYYYQPHFSSLPVLRISSENIPDTLNYIDSTWENLAPDTQITRRFVDEQFEDAYQLFDSIFKAVVGLVCFAFIIASLGLIGLASFITNRRLHEIGIRKTLGASIGQVVTILLYDFSKPLIIANIIAWPFAYLATQNYLNLFADRLELSLLPFVMSLVITVSVAFIAVGGQTIRAARVNPARILRYE